MNKELSIMIIEDDIASCQKYANYIESTEGLCVATITNNPYRALTYTKELLPDVIILNLEMFLGNGLSFLQDLKTIHLSKKPYILVLTDATSSAANEYAKQNGADFIMSKQTENYTEKNVIDFIKLLKQTIQNNSKNVPVEDNNTETDSQRKKRLTRIITIELNNIGINQKAVGYSYLIEAILLIIDGTKNNIGSIIGERYNKTFSSVERAMQNAINKAWSTTDASVLQRYYTAPIHSDKGIPTLTEFIHYYAAKINNDY
ncbi:MAG: sporulation initiation factor Spo0A C-terminal domain-containing protein [Lachnospiraceae bacterium]